MATNQTKKTTNKGNTDTTTETVPVAGEETISTTSTGGDNTPVVDDKGVNDVEDKKETPVETKQETSGNTPAKSVKATTTAKNTPKSDNKQSNKELSWDDMINDLRENGHPAEKYVIRELEAYIENMKPGLPIDAHKGVSMQYRLWMLLKTLIENEDPDYFKKGWDLVLKYFNHYKDGVLGELYVFRFAAEWPRDIKELNGLQRLLNLIISTAEPQGRNVAIKQVDFDRTVDNQDTGIKDTARRNLSVYYNK